MDVYTRHTTTLFKIAMIHLGNSIDAEDAVQEAFFKHLHKAPTFVDETHEKAWLIRVLINICKNMTRSFWRRRTVSLADQIISIEEPEERQMLSLVMQLPFSYKTVIHLFYYEDYSVAEIAEILKISQSAVKMRLKRGRALLKWEWEGE